MVIAEWREGVRSRTTIMLYRGIKNVFEISEHLLQESTENTDRFSLKSTYPFIN